jgi:hypothetical protein
MTDPNLSTSDIASKPDATSDSGRDEDARRQARNEGQAVTAADEPLQREGESGDNRRERGDREPEREPLLSTDESGASPTAGTRSRRASSISRSDPSKKPTGWSQN